MKIEDIIKILNPEILYLPEKNRTMEIYTVAASDLMSDILAMIKVPDLLLTGLNNLQVINTCSIFGIKAVILVRGKIIIDKKVSELAKEEGVILMSTKYSLYESCGRLYQNGLQSVYTYKEKR